MKLWVDDERRPPVGWNWARSSEMALIFLNGPEHWDEMSLDHDLGGDDTTRKVVLWMCENEVWPDVVHVHTANPVGREWLEGMISRYKPEAS